jgi:mRNA-degrading endonuclease RelE of RelBE toxin-antitoxin system
METSERYEVEILRQAEKDLKELRENRGRAIQELLRLEGDPRRGHTLTGSLRGTRALAFNLKGSGAYRAVYTILDDRRVCIVFLVKSHENVYKEAERRWETVKKSLGMSQ